MNHILKPLFAYDKLEVLRRQNDSYEIMLFELDIKQKLAKEKRQELVRDIPEHELIYDCSHDSDNEQEPEV